MNPRFIKYEPNNDTAAKFKGLATVSISVLFNGKECEMHQLYKVQNGKNGGIFLAPLSVMQNNEWESSHRFESNFIVDEINGLIRKGIDAYYQGSAPASAPVEPPVKTYVQSECPF